MNDNKNEVVEVMIGNFMETVDTDLVKQTATKINTLTKIVTENLTPGVHFGEIPGVKGKPTLFKAGAEKVVLTLGLTTKYTIIDSYVNREYKKSVPEYGYDDNGKKVKTGTKELTGFYEYAIECNLIDSQGRIVGSGIGSCNSNETKYNTQDPFGIANTILKMAKKRALVDSALGIANLSDQLTQDLDDMKANGLLKDNTDKYNQTLAGGVITTDQNKRLFASSGGNPALIKKVITEYGFNDSRKITKDKFNEILAKVEQERK